MGLRYGTVDFKSYSNEPHNKFSMIELAIVIKTAKNTSPNRTKFATCGNI